MPRTSKSKSSSSSSSSSSQRWTMPSFFSSGFSDRSIATTTINTTTTGTPATTPSTPITTTGTTATAAATTPIITRKQEEEELHSRKEEISSDKEADLSWIMLHDQDSRPFWFDKSTGLWTYDGKTVYGPPAPATTSWSYDTPLGPHQQQPQPQPPQQQHVSYAQPAAAYYAPGPYTAVHPVWHAPPSVATALVAAPGTVPFGTPSGIFL